jgi:hypothetical protein
MAAEPLALRQILRNAASYVLLIGLAELAGLPDALFVALAAMTVLEVNLGDGLKQGRQRVLATLVGTAVVVMVLGGLQLGGAPGAALAFLLLRLLIFRFALEGGLVVGGHVLAGSFGSHVGAWGAYVFWRSLMTLVGVLAGLVLARNVLPRRNRELWLADLRRWLGEMAVELRHEAAALGGSPAPPDAGLQEALAAPREALRRRRDALELRAAASLPEAETPRIAALWRHRQEDQLFHGLALLRHLQDLRPLLPALAGAQRVEPSGSGAPGLPAALRRVLEAAAGRIEAITAQPEPGTVPAADLPAAVAGLLAAAAAAGGAPTETELEAVQRVRLVGLHTLALSGNDQPLPVAAPARAQAPGREAHQRSIR